MMETAQQGVHEAILFLSGHNVISQMRFVEFEALLDGFVTRTDLAGQDMPASYVRLDPWLRIEALVFFRVSFDAEGRADSKWNLPLRELADKGETGPDLGAGPVRIATKDQCPLHGMESHLWQPVFGASGDLIAVVRAIQRNRLGFSAAPAASAVSSPASPAAHQAADQRQAGDYGSGAVTPQAPRRPSADHLEDTIPTLQPSAREGNAEPSRSAPMSRRQRDRLARVLWSQRQQIRALRGRLDYEVAEQTRENRLEQRARLKRQRQLQEEVRQLEALLARQEERLRRRSEQVHTLQADLSGVRKRQAALELELSATLPESEIREMRLKLENELELLQERLDEREAELFYRDEREEQMRTELTRLRAEVEAAGNDSLVRRLADLDVLFVAYHPGAGHVNIGVDEVDSYVREPFAWVAARCGVSEEHYRGWLEHFGAPVCMYVDLRGALCGRDVPRIPSPREFMPGIDDRCIEHR